MDRSGQGGQSAHCGPGDSGAAGRTEVSLLAKTGAFEPNWRIVSDTLLNRCLEDGSLFLLKEGDGAVDSCSPADAPAASAAPAAGGTERVSLLCVVRRLPSYDFREETFDYRANRFTIKLQAETSV